FRAKRESGPRRSIEGAKAGIQSRAMAKPPVLASLTWTEALRFDVNSARISTVVDGDSNAGASPVQMLVIALAGCMSADIVDIVRKGRHPLSGFSAHIVAERAQEHPTRVV